MAGNNVKGIHERVASVLAERRSSALKLKAERNLYAEENLPGYIELNKKIRDAGIKLGRDAFKGKSSESYKSTHAELENLIEQKNKLAESLGKDFFENVFTCMICKDEGFYTDGNGQSVRCKCYKQLLADMLSESFEITPDKGTFDSFRTDIYTIDLSDKDGIADQKAIAPMSCNEYMSKILQQCRDFVSKFGIEETKNLFLWGNPGVGKSFMCNAIAYELIKNGIPAMYISSPALITRATAVTINDEQRIEKQEFCELVRNIDVLIIDDLGTEKQSEVKYQELLEILNERSRKYGKGLRTVISTNYSQKELFKYYDERIASRIYAEFTSLKFIGENIRFKKK